MSCFPTERALELFLAGDQNGRVAGAPRSEFARDLAAGDALGHIDNFQDRESTTVADVEGFAGNAVDLLKRANVGIGDIEHVDVVADAGAVRCGVVRAEDIDMRQPTAGGIENPGNEMSLHAMMLAAFLGGSGSVEIAEAHVFEPCVNLVLGENGFNLRAIRKVYLAKDGSRRHSGAMALHQAVQRNDGHAARNQDLRADTANVTRRSRNQNLHL